MFAETLTAIEALPVAQALCAGRWSYAAVNGAHVVGIALLFGAIVPLDLRLMGLWRPVPIRTLARILVPVAAFGLVLALAAGALMFSIRATEYAAKTIFLFKLALIVCAIANALLLRMAAQWEASQDAVNVAPPVRLRVAGALSIALWLAVIACGRSIAFVD
jgi:hypothetical protein